MKKIAVYLLAFLFIIPMKAQDIKNPRQDISLSAGVLPSADGRIILDALVTVITLGLVVPEDMATYGSYSASYDYFFKEKFAVGMLCGFSANQTTYTSAWQSVSNRNQSFRCYYYAMPTVKYYWLKKSNFSMYLYGGIGICYRNEKVTYPDDTEKQTEYAEGVFPAFQLTPVACEFGWQRWKFFGEFGFGNKGLLSAGVRYSL